MAFEMNENDMEDRTIKELETKTGYLTAGHNNKDVSVTNTEGSFDKLNTGGEQLTRRCGQFRRSLIK